MYELIPADTYKRSLIKVFKDNQELKKRVTKALQLLMQDPSYPSLKSHKVDTKNHGQRWSSRVTGDIRVIWDYDEEGRLLILLLDIGSHTGKHKVYK